MRCSWMSMRLLALVSLLGLASPAWAGSGMVSFVYDDGLAGVYKYAYPIMSKYNQVGITAVIHSRLQAGNEGNNDYMTTEQILDLQRHGWEIASHGITHKRPTDIPVYYVDEKIKRWRADDRTVPMYQTNYEYSNIGCMLDHGAYMKETASLKDAIETPGSYYFDRVIEEVHVHPFTFDAVEELDIRSCSYERELQLSRDYLEREGFKIRSFVAPYNYRSAELEALGRKYYDLVAVGGSQANFVETFDGEFVTRFIVHTHDTINSMIRTIQQNAVQNNGWVVFCFHSIGDGVGWEPWSDERLEKLSAWINAQKIPVVTLTEGARLLKAAKAAKAAETGNTEPKS